MEHDLVLEGRVVTPAGLQEAEVGVEGGFVREFGHGLRGARKIKTGRCLIFPGFVDIHVHMREPGWEHKEDFRTGGRAAVHGGVTTVVDMPNNPVPAATRTVLDLKKRLASEKAAVGVEFYGGVLAENIEGLRELAGRVVGYKLYLSRTTGTGAFPEAKLGQAFEIIAGTGKPVSMHCEDQSVIDRRQYELAGEERPDLHCDVRPPEAEGVSVRKAIDAMRGIRNLRGNVCHVSTREAISMISKAKGDGMKLQCEATLHHLYFNRSAMLENRLLKTNPPLRPEEDRQALLRGVRDGSVAFLVTDHAPHTKEEKASLNPSGIPGLDDFCHVVSWLIREQDVDPITIAKVASSNPVRHVNLQDRGEISVGKRADFTVLDLHSPERASSDGVRSKCGWSPYEGREFPGRARWVLRNGETLMDDFEEVT